MIIKLLVIFNCGNRLRTIEAVCIPNFNIDLNLPNLSTVSKAFIDKGYKLADSYLYDFQNSISNIDFLQGSKSLHCLKTNQFCFGPDDSLYAMSDLGVLLIGEISSIIENLPYLPCNLNANSLIVTNNESNINNKCDIYNLIGHNDKTNINEFNLGTQHKTKP